MKAYQLLLNCESAPQGYISTYSGVRVTNMTDIEQLASRMRLDVSVDRDRA